MKKHIGEQSVLPLDLFNNDVVGKNSEGFVS